ncbi:MAG TPA: hypothetical protein VGX69_11625, partial [Solirubrobacteraceae bacterium]|nr:hypothetical protein [Solirubrobacteraceae bacterium]
APTADGRRGLALSATKELEPGFRAMLLVAEALFRLDVLVSGDTLRTVVRNLSGAELAIERGGATGRTHAYAFGEASLYGPGHASLAFTLGSGEDKVAASVTIATLRFADRGTVRVTAQAIVRQGQAG